MKDLVDEHRANIARAGVELAEAIAAATGAYSAAVATTEAMLEVAMGRRLAVFNGDIQEAPAPSSSVPMAAIPVVVKGVAVGTFSNAGFEQAPEMVREGVSADA